MAKYYYTSKEDKGLIDRSFNNIAWLFFGKKNGKSIKAFKDLFELEVKEVNVYPQGTETKYLRKNVPGICRIDESDDKLIIEFLGYTNSTIEKKDAIKHSGSHEISHAFASILPQVFSHHPNGLISEGILCKNHFGMIKETDAVSGEFVGQHYYGKMYNETMMDLIATMGINAFNSSNKININDILNKPHKEWGQVKTSYSLFTSITRLTIAAFSNTGFIDYQKLVDNGEGIFDVNIKMQDGKLHKANDFLYGILFDPLHIEEEFDKFMGKGYYRILCEYLDRLYTRFVNKQEIPSEEIKNIMMILPEFLNKKIAYYLKHGIIDEKNANQIISNFNNIWNEMQLEFNVLFTQDDLDEIKLKK